ncbi:hypothetical protein [Candidatus Hydrogenosomobacter endosymbioticus]|uniref:Uncharacterized protein n=1 Tax=Candidatus Hydrogenosomobacter endosymbioticus TaxID=2558174 RepID=A0ABN6L3C6_9PROT|nr:hypothetical protein [Candidatus Hydrogenosomobacter endosymbioticus]BDB96219.1 hypothetical protein HYD_3520 [Candidatus Hydrogenosomobacter endosymbioticus]
MALSKESIVMLVGLVNEKLSYIEKIGLPNDCSYCLRVSKTELLLELNECIKFLQNGQKIGAEHCKYPTKQ